MPALHRTVVGAVERLDELSVIESVGVALARELGVEVEIAPAESKIAVEHCVRILIAHCGAVVGIDDTVSVDILVLDIAGLLSGHSVVRISAHDGYVIVEVLLGEQAVGDIEVVGADCVSLAADGIAGDELASRDIEPLVAVVGESSAYGEVGILVEILVVGNTNFKAP